jgi:Type I phosphodiesterase / nucleotide pyrophosphatase
MIRYLLLALVCIFFFYDTTSNYTVRFTAYDGFYLQPVEDLGPTQKLVQRPQKTVLVLLDGLSREAALTMPSMQKLMAQGQCLSTNTGTLTVSRPVYASISSGVEQDRTGIRNNAEPIPATGTLVESIWEIARRNGVYTTAITDLDWWKILFPRGFDNYVITESANNFFTEINFTDVNLIHPSYIDIAGHDYGATSKEYKKEVQRAEDELASLLPRLDLTKDLLIVTADHGHTWYGGHGGLQPEVVTVLTCYTGYSVQKSATEGAMNARVIGPSLSLFLGLPLPRNARISEADQAALFGLLDPVVFSKEYLSERMSAVQRSRDEQQKSLGMTWEELYQRGYQWQLTKVALGLLLSFGVTLWLFRSREKRELLFGFLWGAALFVAGALLYSFWRKTFDITSINSREKFIAAIIPVCLGVFLVGCLMHGLLRKKLSALVDDLGLWCLLVLFSLLVHIWAFGWPLGFPFATGIWLFYPFYAGTFGLFVAVSLLIFSLASFIRERRSRKT